MSSLSLARSIGGVGSILVLFSFILSDGAALFVAGLILILIAANHLASVTKGRELKGNIQAAVALYAIGTIIALIFAYREFPSFIGSGFTGPLTSADPLAAFFARFAGTRVIGLFATWFFFVVASFYLKKTYDSIALSLNLDLFRTTGIVLLIGLVLLIVFGAGLVVLFLAATLQIAAFLSLEEGSVQ